MKNNWYHKLKKEQIIHVLESGTMTLTGIHNNIKKQELLEQPCWDCVSIAIQLDIPYKLTAFQNLQKRGRDDTTTGTP